MLKPLENVLHQVKCYSLSLKKDGILIITNARVIFKCESEFAFQIVRKDLQV